MNKWLLSIVFLSLFLLLACNSNNESTKVEANEMEEDSTDGYISEEEAQKRKLNRDSIDEKSEQVMRLMELIESGEFIEAEKVFLENPLDSSIDEEVIRSYIEFLKSDELMSLRTSKLIDSIDYGYRGALYEEIETAMYSPHEENSVITGTFSDRKGFDYMDWKYNDKKDLHERAKHSIVLSLNVEIEKAMKSDAIKEAKGKNPHIGMSKEEVEVSLWGKPESINRTVSTYSTREQWVYGQGQYLYFTDGILTSFQD